VRFQREALIAGALWAVGIASGLGASWLLGASDEETGLSQILRLGTGDESNIPATTILFWHIIKQNILIMGLLLSGLVTWGTATTATLLYNGFRLGWIVGISQLLRVPLLTVGIVILPHGPLELAGFIAGGAVGLRGWALGHQAMRSGRFKIDGDSANLIRWATAGVCAVLVAALVEATVTRAILMRVIGNGRDRT
jgi:uncharacterized membrane protein SpoIIM required for sporulation